MSTAPAPTPIPVALLTAEEFGRRPDSGQPEELVRGRIVRMTPPNLRHGQVCGEAHYLLRQFVREHDLGHVLTNDSGVITRRDPDTVRGADVAYYSYARLPKGRLPQSYTSELPELIVEVRSPSDRWPLVLEKVSEYLNAGVTVVIVLDPDPETAHVFRGNQAPQAFRSEDELTLPDVLGDFCVQVGRFFE